MRLNQIKHYPFGLMMSGRSWSEGYRFGFNGQEQDDEVYGEGILNTALYWEYDTRLGRRWNVDPVSSIAPSWSPYRAFFDSPILYSDPSGLYEDPKNGAQRFWNTVTFRGKYNRFADHKATIESLGGKVVNEDFSGKSIKYDVLSTSIGTETIDNTTFSSIEQDLTSWEFEGTSDKDLALAFNMSLSVGDFNPFYGSVVGGGSARLVYPELILMPMPKLGVAFKSVLSKAAASSVETTAAKGGSWAKTSGILRDAVKGKGNYGLGSGTYDEAMQAGRSWVGEGFTISKDGSSWISSNGLRHFRPPSFKPKLNIEQANFQWRNVNKGAWQSNGHLDIIKP